MACWAEQVEQGAHINDSRACVEQLPVPIRDFSPQHLPRPGAASWFAIDMCDTLITWGFQQLDRRSCHCAGANEVTLMHIHNMGVVTVEMCSMCLSNIAGSARLVIIPLRPAQGVVAVDQGEDYLDAILSCLRQHKVKALQGSFVVHAHLQLASKSWASGGGRLLELARTPSQLRRRSVSGRTVGWMASLAGVVGPSAKPQKRTRSTPVDAASWYTRRATGQRRWPKQAAPWAPPQAVPRASGEVHADSLLHTQRM